MRRFLALGDWTKTQRGGSIRIIIGRRWLRFACYYGEPPGSHIGYWRTQWGELSGWNLRIGKRYVGPCLTMFVHTKRLQEPS